MTMDADYLNDLNPQQRQAVEWLDSPQLVIAGAGSGKTRVLTYKIVHLLAAGYEPWRIMALTFTNKAAREMRERIAALVGEQTASKLWMGTFHSIFARLLRRHADLIGYKSNFTIYDATDSRSLIKTIVRDMGLDDKVYKPATVQSAISWAKNSLIGPRQYALTRDLVDSDTRSGRGAIATIYDTYCRRCKVAGAMDFDDLLLRTHELLRDNPDVLRHYQEFFRYVLVDEYQDTNFAQHVIVTQLCHGSGALCVVGDDAQSIYSFRGANIGNILNLEKAYPGLRIFKLERNYRSTRNIIDAAGSLIAKNQRQIPKAVFSENEAGDRIEVVKSFSDYEEANLIAGRIAQLHRSTGDSYDEFAVLYRTNAQSRVLEESLRRRNIPYRIYGGQAFYQRKEIKDAISYMRLAINPADDEALVRIINTPARGIGETTVRKLLSGAIATGRSIHDVIVEAAGGGDNLGFNSGTRKRLAEFIGMIDDFAARAAADDADAYSITEYIIERTRLLAVLLTDNTPESISRQENLRELLNSVRQFVDERVEQGADNEATLTTFLAEVALATDQDSSEGEGPSGPDERVTLMTIHAAKGLEFGNVFVAGVEENLLPSQMSMSTADEVEEERRLLYVAITRARRFCMMSYATSRYRNGETQTCRPSRFLGEINPRYLRPVSGTTIAGLTPTPSVRPGRTIYRQQPSQPTPSSPMARPRVAAQQPIATGAHGIPDKHSVDELHVGMHIEHNTFGPGEIVRIDEASGDPRIIVDFAGGAMRTILLKYAKFVILDS